MMTAAAVYLSVVAVMSSVCFITYGFDKRRAVRGGRRVPERTLHFMAFLGGWPGAILAQRHFRHKTQKLPFRLVFWLTVVLHLGLVGAVTYAVVTSKHMLLRNIVIPGTSDRNPLELHPGSEMPSGGVVLPSRGP